MSNIWFNKAKGCFELNNNVTEQNAYAYFHTIELLLQSYNVKDLDELNKLLTMATEYEQLSEQLGCPLEVYVKLHQQKKFYRLNALNEIIECEIDNPNDDEVYHIQADGIIFNQYDYGWQFYPFKDYKKTWWLKEDKGE